MCNKTDEMIRKAAADANINIEQSRQCIQSAFQFIQKVTQKEGFFDLSTLGLPGVYARK